MRKFILSLMFILNFSSVFALESGEQINGKILKLIPKNFLVLNRGRQDDVKEGEHIQFKVGDSVIGRGLCIKSQSTISFWKIYRINSAEVFKISLDLQIEAIPLSSIRPKVLLKSSIDSYEKIFSAFSEDEYLKAMNITKEEATKAITPDTATE
jgi:hypothetical protein